jgi:hypothetical protein
MELLSNIQDFAKETVRSRIESASSDTEARKLAAAPIFWRRFGGDRVDVMRGTTMLTNLIPSHHAFVLELPGVAEAMVKFDGHHEQLFRTGQLTAYLQGAGFYLIYGFVSRICGWFLAPVI